MSFRDDLTALSARHAALEKEVAHKQRELDHATSLLAEARHKASLPILDNLRIASPCTADWSAMVGDDRTRHCGECNQRVHNISGMTRDEAHALLGAHEGRICVRYFQRHDGTILLADCEVGVRRRRGRTALAITAALTAATIPLVAWQLVQRSRVRCGPMEPEPEQPVSARQQPRFSEVYHPIENPARPVSPEVKTPRPTSPEVKQLEDQVREAERARQKMLEELQRRKAITVHQGGVGLRDDDRLELQIQPKPTRKAHVVITK